MFRPSTNENDLCSRNIKTIETTTKNTPQTILFTLRQGQAVCESYPVVKGMLWSSEATEVATVRLCRE